MDLRRRAERMVRGQAFIVHSFTPRATYGSSTWAVKIYKRGSWAHQKSGDREYVQVVLSKRIKKQQIDRYGWREKSR